MQPSQSSLAPSPHFVTSKAKKKNEKIQIDHKTQTIYKENEK